MSFQWIYVLIAGGAFLIIFFFLIKGCTDTNTKAASAGSLKAAANALTGIAWQTETRTNITMPAADVICPAGSLSLSAERGVISMDGLPAFLPPQVGGRLRVRTHEVALERTNTPAIPLGSVLYGLDDNTQYLLSTDGGTASAAMAARVGGMLAHPNVHVNTSLELAGMQLPRTTKTVIVVTFKNGIALPAVNAPAAAKVYGVQIDPSLAGQTIDFSVRNGATYTPAGSRLFFGDELAAGAVAAGRPAVYECGKNALVGRMRRLTTIYEERAAKLKNDPGLETDCRSEITEGHAILRNDMNIKAADDAYLESIYITKGALLLNTQDGLYLMGCPVIA